MIAGIDRYFQVVKCFRDEDLRADRQPEFTQIDCEMSYVHQDDVTDTFEGLSKYLFKEILGIEQTEPYLKMDWHDAMKYYGSDKPDMRFDMRIVELKETITETGFGVFDEASYIGGICPKGCARYTRKQLDELTDYVKSPQVGAKGLIYARINEDGSVKSSVDKFYSEEQRARLRDAMKAEPVSYTHLTLPTKRIV